MKFSPIAVMFLLLHQQQQSTITAAFLQRSSPALVRKWGVRQQSPPPQAVGVTITAQERQLYRAIRTRCNAMSEDDEEEEADDDDDFDEGEDPLARGIDSVSWLPSVSSTASSSRSSGSTEMEGRIRKDAEILPLFPLGGIVYTPNSEHVLNIFEPRYRQMYSDILMNGTKRFVVSMSNPQEKGRFAQMGVLFELEDLKEVSEQTADQIKYICNHKVTGRVKLHRVLNPEAWESRETYLRVEGTIIDDSGSTTTTTTTTTKTSTESSSSPTDLLGVVAEALARGSGGASGASGGDRNPASKEESALKAAFRTLVELQHELDESVRFTRASVDALAVKEGSGKDGLWQTIRLWNNFADQRLLARQREMQQDFQQRLEEFLRKEKGITNNELPATIGFEDLPAALREEVKALQKRMAMELRPLFLESTLTMQKILEAPDHKARLQLVRYFVQAECNRLRTKKALTGVFSSTTSVSSSAKLDTTTTKDKKDDSSTTSSASSSSTSTDSAPSIPPEELLSTGTDEVKGSDSGSSSSKKKPTPPPSSSIFSDEPDAFQ